MFLQCIRYSATCKLRRRIEGPLWFQLGPSQNVDVIAQIFDFCSIAEIYVVDTTDSYRLSGRNSSKYGLHFATSLRLIL
jgi:hypothetical protein